jgi:hypothetical protein
LQELEHPRIPHYVDSFETVDGFCMVQEYKNAPKQIPKNAQAYASAIVFNIGHPVADAGYDESASPIMRLVLKYDPKNYMALYHAGMSDYILNDMPSAKQHLQKFLEIYKNEDSWRQNAIDVLGYIEKGAKVKLPSQQH